MSSFFFQKLFYGHTPLLLRRYGPLLLLWKVVRKWLCVSIVPFIPFNSMRILGYRLIGFKIGRNVFIGMQCYFDDVHPKRMEIEDDVVISYRVTIACHGPRTRDNRLILRRGCYIGAGATLLGGHIRGDIEVGPYATVGSCALVNRNIPPLASVVGVPARIVRTVRQPWESDDDKTDELMKRYLAESVPKPEILTNMGQFNETIFLQIKCSCDGPAFIHYTIDDSDPTEDSPLYTVPLRIDKATVLRAKVFKAGFLPSEVSLADIKIIRND